MALKEAGARVVSYAVSEPDQGGDENSRWCLLVIHKAKQTGGSGSGGSTQPPSVGSGAAAIISDPVDTVYGVMQLYDMKKKHSTTYMGRAGCFATVRLEHRTDPVPVLCFEQKVPRQPSMLVIRELHRDGNTPGEFRVPPQYIEDKAAMTTDFPIKIVVSTRHDIVYLISGTGSLYLFDLLTGTMIYRAVVMKGIFAVCDHVLSGGIVCISSTHRSVVEYSLDEDKVLPFIVNNIEDEEMATRLATCFDKLRNDGLYAAQLQRLLAARSVKSTTSSSESLSRLALVVSPTSVLRGLSPLDVVTPPDETLPLSRCPMSDALLSALNGGQPAHNIPFDMIHDMTNGFEINRKLGEGAFGTVYKGDLDVIVNSELDTLRAKSKRMFWKWVGHTEDDCEENCEKFAELQNLSVAVKISAPFDPSDIIDSTRHSVGHATSGGFLARSTRHLLKKKSGQLSLQSMGANSGASTWRTVYATTLREIKVLRNFRHTNIVQLLGYYIPTSWDRDFSSRHLFRGVHKGNDINDDSQRRVCLIYELLETDLAQALRDETFASRLQWQERLRIACGVAKAIYFLNMGNAKKFPQTFHRDIKSANIGLTANLVPKLFDCGLAKFVDSGSGSNSSGRSLLPSLTGQCFGTPGYIDPKYSRDGNYTAQSEVFSFGMVLLELITGRVQSIVPGANLYEIFIENNEQNIENCADVRAGDWDGDCVKQWAALCVKCLTISRDRYKNMCPVVNELMNMDRKYCHNKVRVDTEVADHNCVICRMDYAKTEGVCCDNMVITSVAAPAAAPVEVHFYCSDCFCALVRNQCDGGSRGAFVSNRGRIYCAACTNTATKVPFSERCLAANVTDDVYEMYSTAREEVIHNRGLLEGDARTRKELLSTTGQVANCRRYIEENIVVLECPTVIKCPNRDCRISLEIPTDFDSCFALKCDGCHQQFCGWCFVHVGRDAHAHVRQCKHSQRPGNVFVRPDQNARDVLINTVRKWRKQRIESLLSDMPLSNAAKRRVRTIYDSVL